MYIRKETNKLTDGSETFDVWLFDRNYQIPFHAVTERDADSLIQLLITAIHNHTTDAATIRE